MEKRRDIKTKIDFIALILMLSVSAVGVPVLIEI